MPHAVSDPIQKRKSNSGRPPKYRGPSRPVTVTLPDSTLEVLRRIDEDRGLAIVKAAEWAQRDDTDSKSLVEIVQMAPGKGLLVVGATVALKRIPFLHLIEIGPDRHLLALDRGNDFKSLEIAVRDVFDDVPEDQLHERQLLKSLLEHIKDLRKAEKVTMAEILLVSMGDRTAK